MIRYHLGLSELASVAEAATQSKKSLCPDVRVFCVPALGLTSETDLSESSDETRSYVFED